MVRVWLIAAMSAAAIGSRSPVLQGSGSGAALSPSDATALLTRYCVACHNDRLKTGELTLQHIDLSTVDAADIGERETLEKVVRKLLVGAMPPQGAPRPDPAALARLADTLERLLDR